MRLRRAELAAIYRLLRPGLNYRGDPPEKWPADFLARRVRAALAEDALTALREKLRA